MFSGRGEEGVIQDTTYLMKPLGQNLLALKFEMSH